MASFASAASQGRDWVSLARWITVAQGALGVLALFVIGFAAQYINVPVQDPATGQVVLQTFNLRPILLILAILIAVICALFTWLIGFAVARLIFLMLIVLGIIESLARMGGEPRVVVVVTFVDMLYDIGFGFVLVMSLINQPNRSAIR